MGAYDEIRTARLLLRRWRQSDREPFALLNASLVVMEHFPATLSADESDTFADSVEAHFDEYGYGLWVVEIGGSFAGFTGLTWGHGLPVDPALEVGWRFCDRYWGHGYATEAARAALEVGLEIAPSIVSVTAVANKRSWRVMERLGMQRAGEFDHPRVPAGHRLSLHYLYQTP